METWEIWCVVASIIITQVLVIVSMWLNNHSKKKYIQEQISCKKKEIWKIKDQITAIVTSKDKTLINSVYMNELINHLKELEKEIKELNGQLKPKDQDNSKFLVDSMTKLVDSKLGGIK